MKRFTYIIGLAALLLTYTGRVSAGVNDYTVSNFHADYYLSQTADGRSALRTVEQITAVFPSIDQNHGIERAIPHAYDGHKISLAINSVTQADGTQWDYATRTDGNATVLRIGSADHYVHGNQIYDITYAQRDVTKYFADTNDDEFYWNTNGTGWSQPFSNVKAVVHIDAGLAHRLTDNQSCVQGYQGAKGDFCAIHKQTEIDGSVTFAAQSTRQLGAGETVTFVIGFTPHTFAPYKASVSEKINAFIAAAFTASLLVTGPIGVLLIIWFVVHYIRNQYRKGELGPNVTEYIPPKGTSVLVAAKVFSESKSSVQSAQMIDLAVRHYIKIYQTEDKGLFHGAQYEIELVKTTDDLLPEEQEFVCTLFGDKTRLAVKDMKSDTAMHTAFLKNDRKLTKSLRVAPYELYEKDTAEARWFKRAAIIVLLLGTFTISPVMIFAAALALIFSLTTIQLSEKGLNLERYLYGLRDYIKLAETDRLRMLQSPEGAERVGETVDGNNNAQLIKLYERVLPYAVLFGVEKEWNEVLGQYYQQAGTQPIWYSSSAAFSAGAFTSAMSNFNTAASYSSSSGGSSGGGSSGGGGGGGGGGGW